MQSIENFIGQKISSMNNIIGGKKIVKTYYNGNPENGLTDKEYYEDGCDTPYKVITGIGIGHRKVHTFPACNHQSDYNN